MHFRLRFFSKLRHQVLAALAFLPAATQAADDPAALLREDPRYVKVVPKREFEREYSAYPLFFPPEPPPLGTPVDRLRALYDLKWLVSGEVAPFVSEPFYPRLAMLIAMDQLDAATARRIDVYREERLAMGKKLEERLIELRSASPAERLVQVEALSRAQTPRLGELEREAERLRGDLASPVLLRSERERRTNRAKGSSRSYKGRTWEFEIVRNAAFLLDGLSPAQRRLLREAIMEMDDRPGMSAPLPPVKAGTETWFYFSPDRAVLLLPPDLPADLARQVAAYQTEKTVAKRQIRDLVFALDDYKSELDAIRDVRSFALKQAAQIAALEAQAEELREPLAAWWRKRHADVPAALARRLGDYLAEKRMIEVEIISRVMSAKRPLLTFTGQRSPDSLPRGAVIPPMENRALPANEEFQWLTGHTPDTRTRALYKVVHTTLNEARAQSADRVATLEAMRTEIVTDMARAVAATASTAKPSSEALALASINFDQYEADYRVRQDYAAYEAAMFEPGLSPEQRRLLLDAAMEKLGLPLPGGSFYPWPAVR